MTTTKMQRSGRGRLAPAVVLLVAGLTFLGVVLGSLGAAVQPGTRPSSSTSASTLSDTTAAAVVSQTQRVLGRSAPVRLVIPAIGVDGGLQTLKLNADKKSLQLPSNPVKAGWFGDGSTPGEA